MVHTLNINLLNHDVIHTAENSEFIKSPAFARFDAMRTRMSSKRKEIIQSKYKFNKQYQDHFQSKHSKLSYTIGTVYLYTKQTMMAYDNGGTVITIANSYSRLTISWK